MKGKGTIDDPIIPDPEPIHEYFGLSGANYMVLARSMLQSMPYEWQLTFVELMREMQNKLGGNADLDIEYKIIPRKEICERMMKVDDPLADYERGRRRLPEMPLELGQ